MCIQIGIGLLLVGGLAFSPVQAQQAVSPYDFPYGYPMPEYPVVGGSHPAIAGDYYNSEPDPQRELKRIGPYALRLIQTDSARKAVQYTDWYRQHYPNLLDGEMLFMRTMALAQLGQLDEAAESMGKALAETDISPRQFIAGPRRLLAPLHDHPAFLKLREDMKGTLVHGPMLGAMTDHSVNVWVRTVSETPVRVAVSRSEEMSDSIVTEPVLSKADDDYTAEIFLEGLRPDTKYYYEVQLGPKRHPIRADHQWFRTYPQRDQPAAFQMVFGGCAGYVPHKERMWDTIRKFNPRAVLTLGDNVYIDDPESPDQARFHYYRRQSRPEFQQLVGTSPVYSIWDDHDFGMNDSWGGPIADLPYWKPMVWDIFTENWVNPPYESGDQPGGWYDFTIADIQFIMLDTRYYREDAGRFKGDGVENPSMLGPAQLTWLEETLSNSDATFKVLVSSVPWHYDAKGQSNNKVDGWAGYRQEREKIFSWIDEHDLGGVLLLSSDRHRSDAWLTKRDTGYDLYEFSSGQFTNQHTHDVLEGALFGYNEKPSFGLLNFDTEAEDPTVTYRIVDIDGFIHQELTVKRSELEN
ncbi:MAG: alkaline phosphatase D family protein [Balneolaceae bacterium]|nr:alkaline phosphatase D family protein [Balneolaceae bacterium]